MAGLSEQQVQVVWVYVGDNVPPPSPPDPTHLAW